MNNVQETFMCDACDPDSRGFLDLQSGFIRLDKTTCTEVNEKCFQALKTNVNHIYPYLNVIEPLVRCNSKGKQSMLHKYSIKPAKNETLIKESIVDKITDTMCPHVVSFGEIVNANSHGDEGYVLGLHMNANELLGKGINYSKALYILDKERRQRDRFALDQVTPKVEQQNLDKFAVNVSKQIQEEDKVVEETKKEISYRQKLMNQKIRTAKETYENLKRMAEGKKPLELYPKELATNETHNSKKIETVDLDSEGEVEKKSQTRVLKNPRKFVEERRRERILQAVTPGDRRLYQENDMDNLMQEQKLANKLAKGSWKVEDFEKYKGIFDYKAGPTFADEVPRKVYTGNAIEKKVQDNINKNEINGLKQVEQQEKKNNLLSSEGIVIKDKKSDHKKLAMDEKKTIKKSKSSDKQEKADKTVISDIKKSEKRQLPHKDLQADDGLKTKKAKVQPKVTNDFDEVDENELNIGFQRRLVLEEDDDGDKKKSDKDEEKDEKKKEKEDKKDKKKKKTRDEEDKKSEKEKDKEEQDEAKEEDKKDNKNAKDDEEDDDDDSKKKARQLAKKGEDDGKDDVKKSEEKTKKKDSKSDEKENKDKDKKDKEEEEDEKNDSESDSETDDDNEETVKAQKNDRRMKKEEMNFDAKYYHTVKMSGDIMDSLYHGNNYSGETLGHRGMKYAKKLFPSRKLSKKKMLKPKLSNNGDSMLGNNLSIKCKEERELGELNAEHAFRELWRNAGWMYDLSPDSRRTRVLKKAKKLSDKRSKNHGDERRLAKSTKPKKNSNFNSKNKWMGVSSENLRKLKPWQTKDWNTITKHKGSIFLIDEKPYDKKNSKKMDSKRELKYEQDLANAEKVELDDSIKNQSMKKSAKNLSEKNEFQEADMYSRKMAKKDNDNDTDAKKDEKKDDEDEDTECKKQENNGDQDEKCKSKDKKKKKDAKSNDKDDSAGDDDPDDAKRLLKHSEKRGLEDKKKDNQDSVEDEDTDEDDAGNGKNSEMSDKDDGDSTGERIRRAKLSNKKDSRSMLQDSDDDSDDEDEADNKDSKKTDTKEKKKEDKDEDDKKKKKEKNDEKKEKGEEQDEDSDDPDGNGMKKKEKKKDRRALDENLILEDQVLSAKRLLKNKKWDKVSEVNSMLKKKFLLSGRVDGMARKLQDEEVIEESLGRNRVLATSNEALYEMDKNRPILAVSYSELRNLQGMEQSLKRKTKELLKTLAQFPKDGVQIRTKILKIYENGKQRRVVNGESKDIKFVYLDQSEFTFSGKNENNNNGFSKINITDERISRLSTRTYLKDKLMNFEPKMVQTPRK